jgi:hypothetical protein
MMPKPKCEGQRKLTGDQVHGNQHRSERRELGEHVVDLVVRVRHLNRDLREVVRVRAREDLFVVVQILRHRDQMVLKAREENIQ